MERSREGKRAASAPRRLRISCPKDQAGTDAETRMDETPLIEKFKKGSLQAFPVSLAAQIGTTATAWSKRKRHGSSEAQILLERTNVGKNSAERAEMAPSEEEDDEGPVLPSFTPFGRSRSKERAKEDELVMDISNIPRRARSSCSRFSSLRRQLESCSAGTSLKQATTAYQQRSPSPNLFAKRPVGTKNRPLKDFRVMGSPQISDQEVEVAEVLFDLSRSIPSFVQSSKKSLMGLEEEDFNSSSSQVACSPASERPQKSSCPSSDEPKSKRQRASLKQEETTLMVTSEMVTTGVGLAGMDQLQNKQNASSGGFSQKPYFVSSEVVTDLFSGDSQLPVVDEKNANYLEQRNKDLVKERVMEKNLNSNAEHIFTQDDLASPGLSTCKTELCVQVSCKDGEHSKLSSRSHENQQANGTRIKSDPMGLSTKVITKDEVEDAMEADDKRLYLSGSSSIFLRNCSDKIYSATTDKVNKGCDALGAPEAGVENESSTSRILANERNQEGLKHKSGPWKEEQIDFKLLDVKKENDKVFDLCKDQEARSACLPLCTLPLTSNNTVMSTGFPPACFYGKTAPPWSTSAFFSGSSLGRKTSYPAMQLPHTTAQHSVLRMRRCATHVYVAHYIQQRQQFLRQTFWPPACHGGAPYNLSAVPANLQGKEQWSDNDAHLPSLQAGPHVTLAESIATRMPGSRGSLTNLKSENSIPNKSAHVLSVGAGTGTNLGHAMSSGTHAQHAQARMQRNGFASLYMPSNVSPGQNASIFDKSFYQSHSSTSDHQSPGQRTSSPSHLPKRQQVPPSSSHVGLSHPLSTQPHPQLKQQVQQQQQHYATISSSQHYGAGSDGFSGGDQGCPMLNGKQSIRSHQQVQLQGQQAASPSDSLLSHQSSFGPKVRDMHFSVPKENDLLGMPCKGRGTVGGPVQSDLATSPMVTKAHGACEIDGAHGQQQSLGGQQQQYYQRSYPRAPATLSTKSHHNKEQGFLVEMQSPLKQAGNSTDGSTETRLPVSVVSSGPAPIDQAIGSGETVFSSSEQLLSSHQTQKQAVAYAEPVSGANTATGLSAENALSWGNLGNTPPSPGHTVPSSKASHRSGFSNGSYPSSSSPGQQVWNNLQSATNWVPHTSCASRPSSGTFSLCTFPASSSLQAAGSSALNITFNGEGIGVSRKTATVGGPNSPSISNSGEQPSSRVQAQPQGHGQGVQTMFPQQQSIKLQQTRHHQVYQQPHPSSDKHQQSAHQSQLRQQSWPSQAQQPSPQLQVPSSTLQQSHLLKQLHSLPLNATLSSGLSPSVTLGTTSQGKTNTGSSSGQANNEK